MATIQQASVTFHSRSPPAAPFSAKQGNFLKSSFSSGFPLLKIPKLAIKLDGKPRSRRGGGALGSRMSDSAAARYADALANVANSNGTLEQTSSDVEKVEKIFSDSNVYDFFVNPTIDLEKKREVIDEIATSLALLPHTQNFLNVLLDCKRVELIREIVKEFDTVFNKLTDTELAVVSSVVQLDPQHLAQIAKGVQKLTGSKNVRIKTVIDSSLVAGFTIRYGNSGSKLIDMSVKKQLEEIAAQLEGGDMQLAV